MTPKRSRPLSPEPVKYATACSWAARIERAKPAIASPSAVSVTQRVSRTNSGRPTACSSLRTCWLTVGWLRLRPAPARVKLSDCATARNVRSSSGSYTSTTLSLQYTITVIEVIIFQNE